MESDFDCYYLLEKEEERFVQFHQIQVYQVKDEESNRAEKKMMMFHRQGQVKEKKRCIICHSFKFDLNNPRGFQHINDDPHRQDNS